ncbi:PREDICTED: uncharacterized protein LOC104595423 [Nelumbo nucifera]|uniref:Uncharacterized protein LOC104595423 n=1 Tax=Nelumbo nucifera TaxID=4432 RepID=A0A1U7ZKC6_NELNU|nr:PREDICTED: uncharacterized protein LOC104595423 [Nelumbo nucifera]
MATNIKGSFVKVKPNQDDSVEIPRIVLNKKVGSSSKQIVDSKQKPISTVSKSEVKPNQDDSAGIPRIVLTNKVGSSSKQIVDSKQKPVSTVSKSEVKPNQGDSAKIPRIVLTNKKVGSSSKQIVDSKQKPVSTVSKSEREPLRIFYESLSKQIPSSEMAEFWMMEHGLLSPERAKKAYEKKQKRQQQLRMGTPVKSLNSDKPESSQKQQQVSKNSDSKVKKRIVDEEEDYYLVRLKKGKF